MLTTCVRGCLFGKDEEEGMKENDLRARRCEEREEVGIGR